MANDKSRARRKSRSKVSIADVARYANVSTATVSRAINQPELVAPETVAVVQAAIAELNYRPHAAARVLASHKTNTIGLLISDIGGDFFSPMLRGIEAEARENGFNLLIYSTRGGPAGGIPPMGEHNTDGILVFADSASEAELARLHQIGFPVVLIHRASTNGLNIPCVTVENKGGAKAIADHLIDVHGYRRIAFLAGLSGHEDACWREQGYRESLAAHGIACDAALMAQGDFNRAVAQAAVEQWLNDGVTFDAVFAADDESAMGVLSAFKKAGVRVPEDVAVAGFDDMVVSQYLTPPLTTVRSPVEQVGCRAVRQLTRLIRGEPADPLLLLPVELIVRQSCGCKARPKILSSAIDEL